MVGVDLGTRIVKVNISKIRKDHNPIEDVEVPLDPTAFASADSTAHSASTSSSETSCRTENVANTIMQHDASLVGPQGTQYGRRKFGSEASDNMDSWKSRGGERQRVEEKKKIREERRCRCAKR